MDKMQQEPLLNQSRKAHGSKAEHAADFQGRAAAAPAGRGA